MNRKLIPTSRRDRLILLALPIQLYGAFTAASDGEYGMAVLMGSGILAVFVSAYLLQDQPASVAEEVDEYAKIIGNIESMNSQLSALSAFLERERKRVAETKETIKHLDDERKTLEPVVQTQRETVTAILNAHAAGLASNAWKERFFGFGFGTIASLIAAILYDYFKG